MLSTRFIDICLYPFDISDTPDLLPQKYLPLRDSDILLTSNIEYFHYRFNADNEVIDTVLERSNRQSYVGFSGTIRMVTESLRYGDKVGNILPLIISKVSRESIYPFDISDSLDLVL